MEKKLYGEALEGDDALKADCRVYQLSNGTGNGQITVYQVFNGIELYYNDIHLAYCNQDQVTVKNIIEINHCYIGRYECSFGENSCCYLSAGDLSIGSAMKKKSFSIALNSTFVLLIPAATIILSGLSGQISYEETVLDFLFYALFTPVCTTMMNRIMFASEQLMAAKISDAGFHPLMD